MVVPRYCSTSDSFILLNDITRVGGATLEVQGWPWIFFAGLFANANSEGINACICKLFLGLLHGIHFGVRAYHYAVSGGAGIQFYGLNTGIKALYTEFCSAAFCIVAAAKTARL